MRCWTSLNGLAEAKGHQCLMDTVPLQEKLPAGVAVASIGGGVVELRCGKLWEARLTLVPAPPPPPKAPAAQQACYTFPGHWLAIYLLMLGLA